MMPTLIVGILFFLLIAISTYKSIRSIRNNACPGCSGGCSSQQRKSCKMKELNETLKELN